MKVLLIDPPMQSIMRARADWFPMGLAYLAGAAIEQGHDVLIYNGEHDPELDYVNLTTYSSNYHYYLEALGDPQHEAWVKIRSVMHDFRPDVVGITSFSVKIPSALRIAAIAKDCRPTVPVLVGGQHATIMTDEVLKNSSVDFVVRGEGERTFVEFLRCLGDDQRWDSIPGLSFKRGTALVHNSPRPLEQSLDSLPYPARQALYQVDKYEPHALGKLFASRGCPYRCNYCGTQNIWTYKLRHHSAERIVDEIRMVKKQFGTTNFTFFDDVFGIEKKSALDLTRRIEQANLGIKWDCLTRANLVSDELLASMKRAGCTKIDMGVESGSDKILKDTEKGLTTRQIMQGARLIKKHGIFLYMFFMVGLPTETEQDVRKTKEFLTELKPDWAGISIFTPIPGTGIYKALQQQGKLPADPDFAMFSHQSPHSNFAYSMTNRQAFPALAQEMLEYIQAYNGSWRHLIRRGMTRGYHRNPRLLVSDIKKVMSWKGLLTSSHQGAHSRFYDKPGKSMLERE